jgi:7-cyano-7-deazaguanine synthase in queuosine biosynthesis
MIKLITKQEFLKRIQPNPNENISLIKLIEKFILERRKYIFKMPKKRDKVILMVSGGLDSTIIWGILLKKYKYQVYPVYINRGLKKSRNELKSVKFFDKYFSNEFPSLAKKLFILSTKLPPPEIKIELAHKHPNLYFNSEILLDNVTKKQFYLPSATELTFTYPMYGTVYSNYLKNRFNIKIYNIFCGVLPTDGIAVAAQSFTSLRTSLLMMCVGTGCYDWNFASFAFEKEIGHFIDKDQLTAIGKELNLPLHKTWSCYSGGIFQCGDNCGACFTRISSFKANKINDKTFYKKDIYKIIDKLKKNIKMITGYGE